MTAALWLAAGILPPEGMAWFRTAAVWTGTVRVWTSSPAGPVAVLTWAALLLPVVAPRL